jgi:hypothetical protein
VNTYAAYQAKVAQLVLDKSKALNPDQPEVRQALSSALLIYSRHRKRFIVTEVTATGGRLYDLPSDWQSGFSEAGFFIEYPVSDEADQVSYLSGGMCELYQTPGAVKLRFRRVQSTDFLPKAGEKFRVHFPILHTLEAASVSIPVSDSAAVCYLAASELCKVLSVRFAQNSSGVTQGDTMDYRNKDDKFLALSKEFYKVYAEQILPKEEELTAAFALGEFIESPLHTYPPSLYPRDQDGKPIV